MSQRLILVNFGKRAVMPCETLFGRQGIKLLEARKNGAELITGPF